MNLKQIAPIAAATAALAISPSAQAIFCCIVPTPSYQGYWAWANYYSVEDHGSYCTKSQVWQIVNSSTGITEWWETTSCEALIS